MNIQQSPAGQIVKSPKGYSAFAPHSLPPKLEWDNAVVNSLPILKQLRSHNHS